MKLELNDLTKRYGDTIALNRFTLSFEPGIYGILGANGAGKSTLMNLITDNIRREGGSIAFDGKEILEMGMDFRTILGYMPQQQGIYEQMTAVSFISYMARLKGLGGREMREQVSQVLKLTNLESVKHKAVGQFSGGMRQRVLLAQALLGDPKVLILDEPTAGLDPRERVRIRNFIKELARDRIVLLATHIVTDIESIADKVILMKNGRLLKVDTPANLIAALPENLEPVAGRASLEDVYLCFLGE